jgi:hypothetical protein
MNIRINAQVAYSSAHNSCTDKLTAFNTKHSRADAKEQPYRSLTSMKHVHGKNVLTQGANDGAANMHQLSIYRQHFDV